VVNAVRALSRGQEHRVFVVAFDGRSGAGKSMLADAVASLVTAAVVRGDDFYRDMDDDDRRALSAIQAVDRYFDWQRLRSEALVPLARRKAARFRRFNWAVGYGLTPPITVDVQAIVIVEGVYSARPEFDDLLDLKVLVEVPDHVREERRQARLRTVSRDDPQGWDTRWDAAERVYFDTIRPRGAFDLIVAGDA
jgi:uridine kinase